MCITCTAQSREACQWQRSACLVRRAWLNRKTRCACLLVHTALFCFDFHTPPKHNHSCLLAFFGSRPVQLMGLFLFLSQSLIKCWLDICCIGIFNVYEKAQEGPALQTSHRVNHPQQTLHCYIFDAFVRYACPCMQDDLCNRFLQPVPIACWLPR